MSTQFSHPHEELAHLKAHIEKKKEEAKGFEHHFYEKHFAHEAVREHDAKKVEEVLAPSLVMRGSEEYRLLSFLSPQSTDEKIRTLSQVIADHGIKNALELVHKAKDEALEDDFHRFLVQYLITLPEIKDDVGKAMWKALHMTLYEIVLPDVGDETNKSFKEIIAFMEQWYVSMQAVSHDPKNKEKNYYTLEVAMPEGKDLISFYVSVHSESAHMFEKTITGIFPSLQIKECKEDYSIFTEHSAVATSYGKAFTHEALPIKTYKEMESDPITLLLSSFQKIKKEKEGLAFQIVIRPIDDMLIKQYTGMLDDLRKGEKLKRVIEKQDILMEGLRGAGDMLTSMFSFGGGDDDKKDTLKKDDDKKQGHVDEIAMKHITKKLEHTIVETNIRVVASAESVERAESIVSDVSSSFRQYTESNGNSIYFVKEEGRKINESIHAYIYRLFVDEHSIALNIEELATIYHFPLYIKDIGNMKVSKGSESQAPSDLLTEGVVLGVNSFRGVNKEIHMGKEDRMRHMYVIGQTGTGKSKILTNMIVQDIENGDGCCFIDPHGSDIQDILANIPDHRKEDVIYFDPSAMECPMGLNMLEFDRAFPEQKTFVVNEILNIFNKLFDMKVSGGPGFEQYFRNATLLVMEHPESGNTMLEISRIFSDKDFRDYKLSKTKNPLLIQFWQNAEKTTGEQGLQNWTQYVTSKFDVFLSNDIMRPIIVQEKSAFNFRDIMDSKKIFLVNLSKGRLGDINSHLLGLIIVGKFLQAALSRVSSNERPDFFLYIDEFQNVTTPAISAILSEARKYRLSLTVAHQFIAQLSEEIKGAVFGNVGSMCVFRVGPDDAQYLEKQFNPTFTANDLIKVENRHAYVKMLSGGDPKKPFSIATLPAKKGNSGQIDDLKKASAEKYGRPKEEVEKEILRKYML